jgi:hypothetical protein
VPSGKGPAKSRRVSGDVEAPVITLAGANPVTLQAGHNYVEPGATALDNVDGDLTSTIVIDNTSVNTAIAGPYLVIYSVTESEGNQAQATRTLNVVDPPVQQADYYIAPTGNDSNPCSQQKPCRTLNKVVDLVQPGDLQVIPKRSWG